jgi:two-component system, OmpR family, sensor histidine kinase QseC
MTSLKQKLFLVLITATGLVWLAATCWIYIGTTREVESVLDSRLQEAGRMVLSLASSSAIGSSENDSNASHAAEVLSYERQLSCQIWSLDGRLVAKSSGAPNESLTIDNRAGFSERVINGEMWRVFTAEDTAKNLRVLVGDKLGLRESFVADILKGLLAPMFLTIPLLGLVIWVSLNRGFRPLKVLAEDLSSRNADDMTPVETNNVPSEIKPVARSLNNLFAKVTEALRHERDITAFAAHELRTPLAGLRTQAQIAMSAREESTREAALRQIVLAVDRTSRLVRQLLTLARLDAASDMPMQTVNLGEVVQEVIDALPASDKKSDIILDPVLRSAVVTANRESLLLAIRNLHENAARHMPQQGVVRWSLETTESSISIFVEDTGPGIPEEELALVTNRFFRGRNKSALGSGLGLSIVDLALRANGASLNLRNRCDAAGLRAAIVWDI